MHARTQAMLARAALAVLVCCASQTRAAPLGRLFFSPAERAALEYRWQLAGEQGEGGRGELLVNGLVQRSGGRSTIWLNGMPHYQKATPIGLVVDGSDPSRVELRRAGQRPLRLRVGEARR